MIRSMIKNPSRMKDFVDDLDLGHTWDYSTLQQQCQIKEDHAENEDLTKTKEP